MRCVTGTVKRGATLSPTSLTVAPLLSAPPPSPQPLPWLWAQSLVTRVDRGARVLRVLWLHSARCTWGLTRPRACPVSAVSFLTGALLRLWARLSVPRLDTGAAAGLGLLSAKPPRASGPRFGEQGCLQVVGLGWGPSVGDLVEGVTAHGLYPSRQSCCLLCNQSRWTGSSPRVWVPEVSGSEGTLSGRHTQALHRPVPRRADGGTESARCSH